MATIDSEPRPGTAFKKIVEEQMMMDEFMAMIEKKMEADKRYLDDLIDLKKTWNPKWRDVGVWELLSPILAYFTEEISHLTAAQEDILARFTSVQTLQEPVAPFYACEGRMEPLSGIGEALEKAFVDCERCRRSTKTPGAQAIAQDRTAFKSMENDNSYFQSLGILHPMEDRAYRIAVNTQHRTISSVEGWYVNDLPGIVERHQQRAEDIKTFFLGCCGSLGKLASDLSASCSSTLHSNQVFASTRFIAPRHEEIERENPHFLLQKFEYRSFFGGRIVEPIFGLGPQRSLTLANEILDVLIGSSLPAEYPSYRETDWVFDLEEKMLTNTDLAIEISHRDRGDLYLLLKVALWTDSPLFPISSRFIDEYKYPNRVPRKKLRQIVDLVTPDLRGRVMALLERMMIIFDDDIFQNTRVAVNLCHTWNAWTIARDIWRKWDFEEDRPLPDGVTRWGPGNLRTKTGQHYVRENPPTNDSHR